MANSICAAVLVSIVGVAHIKGVAAQLSGFESIQVDFEQLHYENTNVQKSGKRCPWPEELPNGYHFRPCSSGKGFCKDNPGALKPPGTTMVTRCDKNYVMSKGEEVSSCVNGVWSQPVHECVECGRTSFVDVALVHHGENSSRGDFPWMAGLYTQNPDTLKWNLFCGGTLISTHLVLTAAHCIKLKDRTLTAEDIKVGLGKILTNFYSKESTSLIKGVRDIVYPERYLGVAQNFALDVALMDLDSDVTLSPEILPACVDWRGSMSLSDGDTGYLTGFGKTENGASEVLKWSRQKYINYEKCRSKVPPEYVKMITPDKFCITSLGGAEADHGDSGGGLTFVKNSAYYVYGIVSTRPPENQGVVLFTNVLHVEIQDFLIRHRLSLTRAHYLSLSSKQTEIDVVEEEVCKLNSGDIGVCKQGKNCPRHLRVYLSKDQYPPLCSLFGEDESIVCCKRPERPIKKPSKAPAVSSGAKSKEMCKTYAKNNNGICNQRRGFGGVTEKVAEPKEFPHMALIGYVVDDDIEWLCGGSLISDRFVLTAAHCSRKQNRPAEYVLLGEYNRATTVDDKRGMSQTATYAIDQMITHPQYEEPSLYHNIALVKLNASVSFSEYVRPLCLHSEPQLPQSHAVVTGWGFKANGGRRNDVLQKVNASISSRKECSESYDSMFVDRLEDGIIDELMFCAGNARDNSDICQVEGGGPLQLYMSEPPCQYSLVGVASFGGICGTGKVPGGYTRVASHLGWIERTVWP